MDYFRLLRIVILFSLSGLLYIYLGFRIIIRKNDEYSRYISAFYFTQSVIFIINLVIIFIFVEYIVNILYLMLLFVGSIGFGFLFIFVGMLFIHNNQDYFKEWKTRVYYMLLYALVLLGIFFIPENVTINESTDWRPVYSFHFMLYLIIVNIGMAGIPLIILSIRIYLEMKAPDLKRKFLCFCVALYLYFFVLISLTILNYLNLESQNLLYLAISLIVLPSALLMYYGMNKL